MPIPEPKGDKKAEHVKSLMDQIRGGKSPTVVLDDRLLKEAFTRVFHLGEDEIVTERKFKDGGVTLEVHAEVLGGSGFFTKSDPAEYNLSFVSRPDMSDVVANVRITIGERTSIIAEDSLVKAVTFRSQRLLEEYFQVLKGGNRY